MHAIFPEAQRERRGTVPAEEFDFYRRISSHGGLLELLLKMQTFDLHIFLDWRRKEKASREAKCAYDAGPKQLVCVFFHIRDIETE